MTKGSHANLNLASISSIVHYIIRTFDFVRIPIQAGTWE